MICINIARCWYVAKLDPLYANESALKISKGNDILFYY